MDPTIVTMLTDYFTKTGSIYSDTSVIFDRMLKQLDKQDNEKTASVSLIKDRAAAAAHKMSNTRLASGAPLVTGYEAVKQASIMLSDHEKALNLVELLCDAVSADNSKIASLEPGKPIGKSSSTERRTAMDDLLADCGIRS